VKCAGGVWGWESKEAMQKFFCPGRLEEAVDCCCRLAPQKMTRPFGLFRVSTGTWLWGLGVVDIDAEDDAFIGGCAVVAERGPHTPPP
jgi:hypothetical protein